MPVPCDAATLGRAAVVVAHPDDEAVAIGALLLRMPPAALVLLTDGAPSNPRYFGVAAPSRAAYAAIRRAEAYAAAAALGVPPGAMHFLDAVDMEAHRALARLDAALATVLRAVRPAALWSPAWEGGHPDHDVAAFLGARHARRLGIPHVEFPLYHWTDGFRSLTFADGDDGCAHPLDGTTRAAKERLLGVYASQAQVLADLRGDVERHRRAPAYDFTRPASRPTVYEAWRWPVTATTVCDAIAGLDGAP